MLKYVCDRCGRDIESLNPNMYLLPERQFTLISVNGQVIDKLPTYTLGKKEMCLCRKCENALIKFLEDNNDEKKI